MPAAMPMPVPMQGTTSLVLVPGRSAVLIEARSNVGPIAFGTNSVTGRLQGWFSDGIIARERNLEAELAIDLRHLTSGNSLYDAELLRRLDVRRYPISTVVQQEMVPLGVDNRYRLTGEVSLHGLTRIISGTVSVTPSPDGGLLVCGEQVFDIRDFDIPSPAVLMLRIFPDVRVHLQLEFAAGGESTE
jgi:polyisoprenoid-binding protein YceI